MPTGSVYWYDTPSRELAVRGPAVTACGHLHGTRDTQLVARQLPEWIVLLTTDGAGWCRVGARRARLTPGDLVLIPPGTDHGYGADGELWCLVWAHVTGAMFTEMLAHVDKDQFRWRCEVDRTTELMTAAVTEVARRQEGYDVAAGGYLWLAIRLALVHDRRLDVPPEGHSQDLVIASQGFIQAHLGEPITLADIAAHVHISRGHLCRVFREVTGYTPMDYTIKQRLNRAKSLLGQTRLPIRQIAAETGFADPGYFARAFRASTGATPSAFRRAEFEGSGND